MLSIFVREALLEKKCFLSGIARMWGGPLPGLKNTLYIFLFDGRKRCTSCPKEGGGEVIWAMPERKHSFLHEVFPKVDKILYTCVSVCVCVYLF